jgi:hypothetical protein
MNSADCQPKHHLTNRKNIVEFVGVTTTWLFTPTMAGVTFTAVHAAPLPKVGLDSSVKPEPATGQLKASVPLLCEMASETFVVSKTFGPTICADAMSAGNNSPE